MKKILKIREMIYQQFHNSRAGEVHFYKEEQKDTYAAYYTSMYLIQDTGEAILEHMENDFSDNPLQAYLEFWGVMQATLIQQDAICEIYKAIIGKKLESDRLMAWQNLRDKRNSSSSTRLCWPTSPQRRNGRSSRDRSGRSAIIGSRTKRRRCFRTSLGASVGRDREAASSCP
jgi:hypothetical protein